MTDSTFFKKNGYLVIPNFIEENFLKFIEQYFYLCIMSGKAELSDHQAPFGYSFYGDPLMETVLQCSTKKISELCGIELSPTYSYTRLYKKGDELECHKDRPECEISATIALGNEGDLNSIYFSKDKENISEIKLNPGDACLYKGSELYHWRDRFTQEWYLQSFIHFVDKNGEYKESIYDGRPYLGMKSCK